MTCINSVQSRIEAQDLMPHTRNGGDAIASIGAWLSDPAMARSAFKKATPGMQIAENEVKPIDPAQDFEKRLEEAIRKELQENALPDKPHFLLRPQK